MEGNITNISDLVRGYAFFSYVVSGQENDPACRSCSSFHSVLSVVQEAVSTFARWHRSDLDALPDGLSPFFRVARARSAGYESLPLR